MGIGDWANPHSEFEVLNKLNIKNLLNLLKNI